MLTMSPQPLRDAVPQNSRTVSQWFLAMSGLQFADSPHSLPERVCHALNRQRHLFGRGVQYELVNRDVILTGSVASYFQKQMAQESLRQIDGIRRIVNELQVVSR